MSKLTIEEWIAKRDELQAQTLRIKNAPLKDRGFLRMQLAHGAGPDGAKCSGCVFLIETPPGYTAKNYRKCSKYGVTGGPGTDWRVSNPACGLFQAKEAA